MKEYKLSTVIQLKKELSDEQLEICEELIQDAFDNNLGCLKRKDSEDKFKFIFEGKEDNNKTDRPCLEIGVFHLKYVENFLQCVEKWDWIESNPVECCDMLKIFEEEVSLRLYN